MDYDVIGKVINALFVPLSAAVGWLFRRLSAIEKKAETAQKDVNDHKILVASAYVTRAEFMEALNRIDYKLDRIYDRVDRKVDK